MNVELFTLCDFARAEPTGKMYVIGTFDHISAPQQPIQYPLFAVAAKVRFERAEEGLKNLSVSFVDSDGTRVLPVLNVQIQVRFQPGEPTATMPFVVLIPQISLPRFGEYQIDLLIDGRIESSIPLYVRQIQIPPINPIPGLLPE